MTGDVGVDSAAPAAYITTVAAATTAAGVGSTTMATASARRGENPPGPAMRGTWL
jgi:hypothetical protein